MKCSSCGTTIEKGETRCPLCGAPAEAGQGWDAPQTQSAAAPAPERREMTKSEFFSIEASKKVRSGVKSSAILCYVCAVVTGLAALLLQMPLMFIDVAIILIMGLGIQLKQSRVCAIVILVYSVVNCLISLVANGQLSGWLLILAGVYAVINTFKLEKDYQAWKSGN